MVVACGIERSDETHQKLLHFGLVQLARSRHVVLPVSFRTISVMGQGDNEGARDAPSKDAGIDLRPSP